MRPVATSSSTSPAMVVRRMRGKREGSAMAARTGMTSPMPSNVNTAMPKKSGIVPRLTALTGVWSAQCTKEYANTVSNPTRMAASASSAENASRRSDRSHTSGSSATAAATMNTRNPGDAPAASRATTSTLCPTKMRYDVQKPSWLATRLAFTRLAPSGPSAARPTSAKDTCPWSTDPARSLLPSAGADSRRGLAAIAPRATSSPTVSLACSSSTMHAYDTAATATRPTVAPM
mmetsp:Transcript_13759/g.44041  ORF Transcript_13759/g.44041 Transcript_13759/m.44041 type:complete len:233 (-) Transcript_13759:321-1019(-)